MIAEPTPPRTRRRIPLVIAMVVGWAIIGFGAKSALSHSRDAHPFALAVHVVSFDLVHDLVIAPLALVVAFLITKVMPEPARGPVRTALAASAFFGLFAYPLIRRWGRRPTNSSTLPLDYGRNLVIVLVAVWLVAAIVIVLRVVRLRSQDVTR